MEDKPVQFAILQDANFSTSTLTFQMECTCSVMAGKFALVPKETYDEMIESLEYYFSVLKEVNGENWNVNPDHVLQKILTAHKHGTAK